MNVSLSWTPSLSWSTSSGAWVMVSYQKRKPRNFSPPYKNVSAAGNYWEVLLPRLPVPRPRKERKSNQIRTVLRRKRRFDYSGPFSVCLVWFYWDRNSFDYVDRMLSDWLITLNSLQYKNRILYFIKHQILFYRC